MATFGDGAGNPFLSLERVEFEGNSGFIVSRDSSNSWEKCLNVDMHLTCLAHLGQLYDFDGRSDNHATGMFCWKLEYIDRV